MTVIDLSTFLPDPTKRAQAAIKRLSDPRRVVPHIEARVQKVAKSKKSGQLIAYLPGRVVAQVLDDVIGPTRYTFEVTREPTFLGNSNLILTCRGRLTIHLPDGSSVYRDDAGTGKLRRDDRGEIEETSVDAAYKGSVTDAFKRCAAAFGVGRCLYQIPDDPNDPWRDWVALDEYKTPDPREKAAVIEKWQRAILASLTVAAIVARPAQSTGAASDEDESGTRQVEPSEGDAERKAQDQAAEGRTRQEEKPAPAPAEKPAPASGDVVAARNVEAGHWTVDDVKITSEQLRTVVRHCNLTGPDDLGDDDTWAWVRACLTCAIRGEELPGRGAEPAPTQEATQPPATPPATSDPSTPSPSPTEPRTERERPSDVPPANAGKPMTEAQARLIAMLEEKVGADTVREAANGVDWRERVDVVDADQNPVTDEHGEIVTEYVLRRAFASALISTLQREVQAVGAPA